jgi:hypothetical protein
MLCVALVDTIFLPRIKIAWRDPAYGENGVCRFGLCCLGACYRCELNAGARSKGSFKDVALCAAIKTVPGESYEARTLDHTLPLRTMWEVGHRLN